MRVRSSTEHAVTHSKARTPRMSCHEVSVDGIDEADQASQGEADKADKADKADRAAKTGGKTGGLAVETTANAGKKR